MILACDFLQVVFIWVFNIYPFKRLEDFFCNYHLIIINSKIDEFFPLLSFTFSFSSKNIKLIEILVLFNIQFPNNYFEDSEITIINSNGQVVKKQTVSQNELTRSNTIEFNGLNNGFYIVKIRSSKFSKVIKLIVQ